MPIRLPIGRSLLLAALLIATPSESFAQRYGGWWHGGGYGYRPAYVGGYRGYYPRYYGYPGYYGHYYNGAWIAAGVLLGSVIPTYVYGPPPPPVVYVLPPPPPPPPAMQQCPDGSTTPATSYCPTPPAPVSPPAPAPVIPPPAPERG